MKPTTTLELVAFYPRALSMAAPWLVSGLISTEVELIELTLKYHQELTANEDINNPMFLSQIGKGKRR
jgi:hypothetical protein